MKPLHLFFLLASLLTLTGCDFAGNSLPTPIPQDVLPTAIYQTAVAANATNFALTPSPTSTFTPEPTFTPTLTATPSPVPTDTPFGMPALPDAKVYLVSPGEMSKVASDLQIRAYVVASDTHIVEIGLYGEDGRLIARDVDRILTNPPTAAYISTEIHFEVRASELGHLVISTRDRFGRLDSLYTTFLLLLPVGPSEINPPPSPFERAFFFSPEADSIVTSGTLNLQGFIWPFNKTDPVIIDVQDESGRVLFSKIIDIVADTYAPFSASIPYEVSQSTPVRLSIHQSDSDKSHSVDGYFYYYSQLITLAP